MSTSLETVVAALERIAPLGYAAEWDNVGLLVEPWRADRVARCLLAIDPTHAVVEEAEAAGARLIVAYHPPIFAPLRRLARSDPRQAVVLHALDRGIALYSPHTALDAVPGGVNDWLADGLGQGGARRPLEPATFAEGAEGAPDPAAGQGREVVLAEPAPLDSVVERIKARLGLDRVRIAPAARHEDGQPIATVALCPGAGGSVVRTSAADLYWTGEMRHHDVLESVALGRSVVLCEHTNTERGFLPVLGARLRAELGDAVDVLISRSDREPLRCT